MRLKDITLENIYAYCQGKFRHKLYFNKRLSWLLPLHIYEQISYRIFVMDKDCYALGSCKMCGCETPALQMANKACKKPCYPKMMNKVDWFTHKYFHKIEFTHYSDKTFSLRISKTTTL